MTEVSKEELITRLERVQLYCSELARGGFKNSNWVSTDTMALAESISIIATAMLFLLEKN